MSEISFKTLELRLSEQMFVGWFEFRDMRIAGASLVERLTSACKELGGKRHVIC